jgi:hypothetical protein
MGIMISSKYIGKGSRYPVLIELEKYVFEKKEFHSYQMLFYCIEKILLKVLKKQDSNR